uniref:Uncharacterized protein n=1 Tax=Lotus japonicus TaxID=34305 RepID=I3SU03_LOTJA|nr:unknown [Lotus japonicus]
MILAPTNTTSGFKVLVNKMFTLLKVVDTFDAVAPTKLLPNDLGLLDLDPLLPDDVFPHLQHRHRVLVRMSRIEIVRRRFIELNVPLLSSHFLFFPTSSLSVNRNGNQSFVLLRQCL